jgi:hypothetical protein
MYSKLYQNSVEACVPLIFYFGSERDDGICHYELDQFNKASSLNEGAYALKLQKFQREEITEGMADQNIIVSGDH